MICIYGYLHRLVELYHEFYEKNIDFLLISMQKQAIVKLDDS